jgi:hypothetical protein
MSGRAIESQTINYPLPSTLYPLPSKLQTDLVATLVLHVSSNK